jgi:hypothetical protein
MVAVYRSRRDHRCGNWVRAVCLAVSMAGFAVEDVFVKAAAQTLPLGQVLLTIGLVGMLVFSAMARWQGEALLPPAFVSPAMLVRSGFEIVGRLFYGLAIRTPLFPLHGWLPLVAEHGNVALAPKIAKAIIDEYLAPLVIGQDPWDYEYLWQRMYRATHAWGRKGVGMAAIVKALIAPFSIPVVINTNVGEPFKKFSIEQGETVYEAIKRMAELRAVLVLSDGRGGIVITNRATTRAADPLVCNVLSASFTEDYKELFSSITVKGQTQGSSTVDATTASGPKSTVTVSGSRYRPLVIMADGQANAKECKERAQWEAKRRKANSHTATVTVQGWRQSNGWLWAINTITKVTIPTLKLDADMLITGVDFSLNEQGTLTTLTLTEPEAYDLIREQEQTA